MDEINGKNIIDEKGNQNNDIEEKIKMQNEIILKMKEDNYLKEKEINSKITDYKQEISDLKTELELLNNTISNLTEEKEFNNNKISQLLKENSQLKKNGNIGINDNSKKYEEIIKKLKKTISNLELEKKDLEEVIIKQETEVTQLNSQSDEISKK